jgi:hypothetical protein
MAVEVSFNNIVRKFTLSDYFATHQILQQGRSNWPYLRCLWDLQVLFYNLFSCAQGHGNPCNAILGVAPPTISEYLIQLITTCSYHYLELRKRMTTLEMKRKLKECIIIYFKLNKHFNLS